MIHFKTTIKKFGQQGEKTGWTYILIPNEIADKIHKGVRKSYQVKGTIDEMPISAVSLLPMGEGDFIIPLNADMRQKLRKKKNDEVQVKLELDKKGYMLNEVMMECIKEDPIAFQYFETFPRSHQNYYSKWIESAKTDATKARRIVMIIKSLHLKQNYSEMIRSNKKSSH